MSEREIELSLLLSSSSLLPPPPSSSSSSSGDTAVIEQRLRFFWSLELLARVRLAWFAAAVRRRRGREQRSGDRALHRRAVMLRVFVETP